MFLMDGLAGIRKSRAQSVLKRFFNCYNSHQIPRSYEKTKKWEVIDFSFEITILFSYEAMTQGAHIGRLQIHLAGHLESK
jgi:hypothetical protein